MGCGTRVAGALLAVLMLAAPAMAEGWRPEVAVETDAEWFERLDTRLQPVQAAIRDTIALASGSTDREADALVVLVQEQAIKGIAILDAAEPARACARDWVAVLRVAFLLYGDSADAWTQMRAGSSQAEAEVAMQWPAANVLNAEYSVRLHDAATCLPRLPETPVRPTSTATPSQTEAP